MQALLLSLNNRQIWKEPVLSLKKRIYWSIWGRKKMAQDLFQLGLFCGGSDFSNADWKGKGLAAVGFSYEFENIYKWMRKMIPAGLQHFLKFPKIENKKIGKYSIAASSDIGNCISADRTSLTDNLPTENAECYSHCIESKDLSISQDMKPVLNTGGTTSLCSDYFLIDAQETKADCSVSRTPDSNLCADSHINSLASHYSAFKEWQPLSDGKHAFAGAFAGIFVSLCLHPIDTVKTVIQSCHAEQKSIFYIGRSIISERGFTGLYSGIASNIASSAPISALYTFSYESVKGALLPLLPKEYHSLAHCMAGGCASVATSFIFTPSERIKQQMQVGAHYQNCWNALVEIIRKGGLPLHWVGGCTLQEYSKFNYQVLHIRKLEASHVDITAITYSTEHITDSSLWCPIWFNCGFLYNSL
ncbi:hypothetical protein V6Z11_A09G220200 [Gossypium hirsutum]